MQYQAIFRGLKNEKVVNFVMKQYINSYVRYFSGHEDEATHMIEKAFFKLKESQRTGNNKDKLHETIYSISNNIFRVKDDSFWFNKMHYAYKTLIRPKKDFETIKPLLSGRIIHDFGCDGGFFALELLKEGYKVLLSDVIDHRIVEVKNSPFYLMKNPTDVGHLDTVVDSTIVKTVLHHIDNKYLMGVLKKLRSTKSRLIIEEDVYGIPTIIQHASKNLVSQENFIEYASFSLEEQYDYAVLTDYFSNSVIYGRPDITFPFEFKTVSEWIEIFTKAGFQVVTCVVNGFNTWKLTQNCQAWFVCE